MKKFLEICLIIQCLQAIQVQTEKVLLQKNEEIVVAKPRYLQTISNENKSIGAAQPGSDQVTNTSATNSSAFYNQTNNKDQETQIAADKNNFEESDLEKAAVAAALELTKLSCVTLKDEALCKASNCFWISNTCNLIALVKNATASSTQANSTNITATNSSASLNNNSVVNNATEINSIEATAIKLVTNISQIPVLNFTYTNSTETNNTDPLINSSEVKNLLSTNTSGTNQVI